VNRPLIFFLPDVMGGVASVINNIISFGYNSNEVVSVVAYRGNYNNKANAIFSLPDMVKVNRFCYDENDNLYLISSHLKKFLNVSNPVLVSTDSLELNMIQLLKLDCKLVFIVLGDFEHYYQLAVQHQFIINRFIVISEEIKDKLSIILPHRISDIFLAYFPTPNVSRHNFINTNRVLNIIYAARLEKAKQPLILVEIDKLLKLQGVCVQWTVAGNGELEAELKREIEISGAKNFTLTGLINNQELHRHYLNQDLFILPSLFEGLPVSLIEAMKSGLIPIVSDIEGGVREIVKNGINGYLCQSGNAHDFAKKIAFLAQNKVIKTTIEQNVTKSVRVQFDPVLNSNRYFNLIQETKFCQGKKQFGVKLNRLDKKWIPSVVTRNLRQLIDLFH